MQTFVTNRPRLTLLLILTLAVGLRLAWIGLYYTDDLRHFENGDYIIYRHGGEHIRQHGDLSNSLFLLRPPLFPFLITLAGVDSLAVLILDAILGATLAPLTVILARQLGLRPILAALAGLIIAVDPASIVYASWLGAEPLANLFFLLMVVWLLYAVSRTGTQRGVLWGAAAGLALTLSVLARPTAFLIWTGLAVYLLIMHRSRWPAVAVYALVSVIGIGAWMVHNGRVFNNYTVSSVGTYSLLYYRAASVEHWASGDDMETVYIRLAARVEEQMGRDPALADSTTRHTHYAGPSKLTSAMNATAIDVFTDHPDWYVLTIPVGLARMYVWTNNLPRWTRLFEVPWNLILVLGTTAGLWQAWRRKYWPLFWWVLLVCGYFTAATILAQTSGLDTRMRSMLVPFLACALVYALDTQLTARSHLAR